MTTSKLERNLTKNRFRSFLFQLKGENTHAPLHHRSNRSSLRAVYTFTSFADPSAASDFRATLLKETDLDVVHQADGYLTLSTCNNGGGNSRVLVIAALAGEVTS